MLWKNSKWKERKTKKPKSEFLNYYVKLKAPEANSFQVFLITYNKN